MTESRRACNCGGGGALDQAGHHRCRAIQGESQARIARSARGQDGAGGGPAAHGPPLSAPGLRRRGVVMLRRVLGEPGVPAEAERAVDQGLVPADRGVGADLEVSPAQLVLDLLVALLDPVPDAVDRVISARSAAGCGLPASRGPPGRGRLVARYQVALSGRAPGSAVTATRRVKPSGPHQPSVASAAYQVSACPSRKVRVTGCQSPGSAGPSQASARAASAGV